MDNFSKPGIQVKSGGNVKRPRTIVYWGFAIDIVGPQLERKQHRQAIRQELSRNSCGPTNERLLNLFESTATVTAQALAFVEIVAISDGTVAGLGRLLYRWE